MRSFSIFLTTCALSHAAMAQTPDCRSVADPTARLACYDRLAPPVAAPAAVKPVARAAPVSKAYDDPIGAEDAAMNERMKGICRGC